MQQSIETLSITTILSVAKPSDDRLVINRYMLCV